MASPALTDDILESWSWLGVTPEMLRTKTAADLFQGPIAEKVKTTNVADLAGPLKEIFAKGFGTLIPVLKTDFEELSHKMEHLGSIMSTEAAVSVKLLAEEFGLLSNIIAAQLAPGLAKFAEFLLWSVGQIQTFGAVIGAFVGSFPNAFRAAVAGIDTKHKGGIIGSFLENLGSELKGVLFESGMAGVKTLFDNEKLREALAKAVAEMAEKLKHPTAPTFEPPEVDDKEKTKKTIKQAAIASDSLTAVGNFLGSNRSNIESIAQSQLDRLDEIARNTRFWNQARAEVIFSGI